MNLKFLCWAVALLALHSHAALSEANDGFSPRDLEVDLYPEEVIRSLEYDSATPALDDLLEPGVINGIKRWNPNSVLNVCFFGGPQQVRSRISKIASEWNIEGGSIRLDFGKISDPRLCSSSHFSEIRVGFTQRGMWSLVGQDSILAASQSQASLNLQRFDRSAPQDEQAFRRYVLHEFGHALGFLHEHQHPELKCEDEYNWSVVYSDLAGPPNEWTTDQVDHAMKSRKFTRGAIYTTPDPESIMFYARSSKYFREGKNSKCFIPKVASNISDGDRALYLMAYGPSAAPYESDIALAEAVSDALPETSRAQAESAVEILAAQPATKARILGIPRPQFLDVDIFLCPDPARQSEGRLLENALSEIGSLGRVRLRNEAFPGSVEFSSGVTLVTDDAIGESKDSKRISNELQKSGLDAKISRNLGAETRWYISMFSCK